MLPRRQVFGLLGFAGTRPKSSQNVPRNVRKRPRTSLKTSQDVLETSQEVGHCQGMAMLAITDPRGDRPENAAGLSAMDVMTPSDVAEFLHIAVSTVYELTRRGELPARRVGRTWRFLRPRLEEYLWS